MALTYSLGVAHHSLGYSTPSFTRAKGASYPYRIQVALQVRNTKCPSEMRTRASSDSMGTLDGIPHVHGTNIDTDIFET